MKIKLVRAREILDSRGNPTVSAMVILDNDVTGSASVPSGASTGSHEAVELRDGDNRFGGLGVLKAVQNINTEINDAVFGISADDQAALDRRLIELDGTENKSRLGANAILAVSLATARASAHSLRRELYEYIGALKNNLIPEKFVLPVPMMNILNGGRHANWVSDFQEYMILPVGAQSFSEGLRMGAEIYQTLKSILQKSGRVISVGDEGGFAPSFSSNEEPFALIAQAIEKSGYTLGKNIFLGTDIAASEFFSGDKYVLKKDNLSLSREELGSFYENLLNKYPIISIEDPFAEDDWQAFSKFNDQFGNRIQVVGDDLYATNTARIKQGIDLKSTNSVLIKPNQIGTLTETIDAIKLTEAAGYSAVVSHRSGETEDSFIADLAVGCNCGQIKTGAPARGERIAKYNRLLEIETKLGDRASYFKHPLTNL